MKRRTYKGLWALVGALAWAGCSDLGAPLRLVPSAELSATALDFGTVVVNGSATRSVVVSNSGNGDLKGFASVSCAGYSIQSGGGAFTVHPGGQHAVQVVYSPSAPGSTPCELQLGGSIPPVTLSGAGALQAPGAQCVLSVASLDFGSVAVGSSKLATYVIRNPGTAGLIVNVVPSCGDFTVVSGGGPGTVAAGDSLVVSLQFVPQAGGDISCSIATGPACPDLPVTGAATTISVSFAADIKPILQQRGCVGCHFEFTQRPDQMVGVETQFYRPHVYIQPFDLANSVIYGKITNSGQYGNPMPLGSANGLAAAERDKFRRWILEGALDN